ncbi:molecular chaperone HtpG [Allorhizobium taibaishanense]|uniref:Chaperone protein HtpG n=1 Tax=Allorhizobium taibaishanense TaxID=887144 RepID=A0A1Q9A210_9HYPH|nr:molecular chaperone HtpG [Allorhizobium taibaishanense]MBB4009094.1 molecular chaperone HtpG [Allorhizobium taibaishanense]OLP48607.1 molecular chaperone HtpG [Allorhizobium taibaishanense]
MSTEPAEKSATTTAEQHVFEADVARLLHMMVHSVYSDKDVFLRELVSNAADACEKLRYEAITTPGLLAEDPDPRIRLLLDAEQRQLIVEDNGIGMSRGELVEALGTIARSGTRAFMEKIEASKAQEEGANGGAQLIGQFGVGFYSCFMVADRVDVATRRAGEAQAWMWSSDGKGSYSISELDAASAPARGTRITLHLMEEAKDYTSRHQVERIVKQQSGHVPVPISLIEKPGAEPVNITDGSALWTRSKSEISKEDYADFYRGISGQYDEPALTVHFHAEGRHDYRTLAFVPGTPPFDLFDPDRKGRIKLYVKRVFITDDAELLPRYLRFVRGLVDTADLPLNVSREMIQESPILSAIRKGVTNRVLTALEKLAESEPETYLTVWQNFGAVLKEGIYEDFERRSQLLGLARFRTTTSGEDLRSLADYVKDMKPEQDTIYYLTGSSLEQIKASPQLEGFRARGIEVLLLSDQVDSFWVMNAPDFEGKTLKSVSQGAADLAKFAKPDGASKDGEDKPEEAKADIAAFLVLAKEELKDDVADVRASDRLTESPVCLVAAETGYDRQLEKILAGAGQLASTSKPVLELNADHALVKAMAHAKHAPALQNDAIHLLYDQARILDGEKPADARAFAERMGRLLEKALGA